MTPLTDPQRRSVDDAATALRGIARQLDALQESLAAVPTTGVVRDALRESRRVLLVERRTLLQLIAASDADGTEPDTNP